MRDFLFFFALNFTAYGLLCWNYRAVARGWYGNIVLSDLSYAALNFLVIKNVVEAHSPASAAGYILGGAVGSVVSVYLTKRFSKDKL